MRSSLDSRATTGMAAVILSASASAPATAQPLYHLQDLGARSYPVGHLTVDGKIAGSFQNKAAYWNGDHWVFLAGAKVVTGGVANNGEAAGTRGGGKKASRARVWTAKGHHQDIVHDAEQSFATAISTNGVVYGYAIPDSRDSSYTFAWQAGELTVLPPDAAGFSIKPSAANNAGQVVGSGEIGSELYTAGTWTQLPQFQLAKGINDLGSVVGSTGGAAEGEALLYENGVTTDLGFPGIAWDINHAGDIVGEYVIDDEHSYAVLIKSGTNTLTRLDEVVDQLPGNLLFAVSINDAGTIAIYGADSLGTQHVYLLTPLN